MLGVQTSSNLWKVHKSQNYYWKLSISIYVLLLNYTSQIKSSWNHSQIKKLQKAVLKQSKFITILRINVTLDGESILIMLITRLHSSTTTFKENFVLKLIYVCKHVVSSFSKYLSPETGTVSIKFILLLCNQHLEHMIYIYIYIVWQVSIFLQVYLYYCHSMGLKFQQFPKS